MKEIREAFEGMGRGLHVFHLVGMALTLLAACLSLGDNSDPSVGKWDVLQTAQAVQSIQNAHETAEALVMTWEPAETPTPAGTPFDQAHDTPAATPVQYMPEVIE